MSMYFKQCFKIIKNLLTFIKYICIMYDNYIISNEKESRYNNSF